MRIYCLSGKKNTRRKRRIVEMSGNDINVKLNEHRIFLCILHFSILYAREVNELVVAKVSMVLKLYEFNDMQMKFGDLSKTFTILKTKTTCKISDERTIAEILMVRSISIFAIVECAADSRSKYKFALLVWSDRSHVNDKRISMSAIHERR